MTTKSAEANYQNAKLTREVAQIAVIEYTEGIFVQGIRPPTVPPGTARLRVGLSAVHSDQHIEIIGESIPRMLRAEGVR